MVAMHNQDKRKGVLAESRCGQEFRKLQSFINYDGKDHNNGGGRVMGNFLLKLK